VEGKAQFGRGEQLPRGYVPSLKVKRLKASTFIYRHLHEHDQQRFTIRSGVLTGNDARFSSASNGSPLSE